MPKIRSTISTLIKTWIASGADPELGNCGSSHFKRLFIRDYTELKMNTL
jgi:hypothetical protein